MDALRYTAALAVFLLPGILQAQTWNGGGVGAGNLDWVTPGNWAGGVAPLNNGTASVVFAGSIDTNPGPNLDQNWNVNSVVFNNTAGSFVLGSTGGFTLTVGAGGITNNDDSAQTISHPIALGAAQTWSVASTGPFIVNGAVNINTNLLTVQATGSNVTLSGAISGGGGLTKAGGFTVGFSGSTANTFTGTTTVNGGLLVLQKTAGVNAMNGPVVIGDGVGSETLLLLATNQIPNVLVTVNSSGVFDLSGNSEGLLQLVVNGGSTSIGAGVLTLGTSLTMTGGSVSSTTGSLMLQGALTTNAAATSATIGGNVDLGGSVRTFTVADGAAATDLDVTAVVSNGSITKAGAGALRLSGANSTLAILNLNGGTLIVANDAAVGTNQLVITVGTTIQAEGTRTLALSNFGLNGNFTVGGADLLTFNGTALLSGNRTITTTNTQTTTFSGVLGEASAFLNLTKAGPGTLALTGAAANTFTGITTVNEGALELGKTAGLKAIGDVNIGDGVGLDTVRLIANNQIADGSVVFIGSTDVSNRGILDLNGNSDTIGTLNMTGGLATFGGGKLTLTSSLNTNAISSSAIISTGSLGLGSTTHNFNISDGTAAIDLDITATVTDTGGITKLGAGTLRMGNNTFGGGVTVTAGTLAFAGNVAAGAGGVLTFNGGVVQADGAARTIGNAISINANSTIGGSLDLNFTGPITMSASRTLTVDNSGTTTFSGAGGGGGSTVLTKVGTGTLVLSGPSANTFFDLRVNAGTVAFGKTAGTNAVAASVTIGDSLGGAGADVVRLDASEQIPDGNTVVLTNSGLFNLNGFYETICELDFTTGGDVQTGAGTLTVLGGIFQDASSATSTISGSLGLGGATPTISSQTNITLNAAISNGGILSNGVGTLVLGGSAANTCTGTTTVTAGTLQLSKTGGSIAIAGPLVIGDGTGGANADVVRHTTSDDIADSASVTMASSGLLDLNGNSDMIGALTMTGGAITTGAGTLTIGGSVTTSAHTAAATIAGNLNLGGAARTFAIADGTAATDLDVTATVTNGGILKTGAGKLNISGVFASGVTLNAGTLSGTITVPAGATWTQNGGTFSGTLIVQGSYVHNGGTFTGTLNAQGTSALNANLTVAGGLENSSTLTVGSGVTLTANGTGFSNLGTATLENGTLAGTSATNDFGGQMNARGTITAPFINNGTLDVTGLLTLSAAASNAGSISVATTESLRVNGAFANSGIITLSGGSVSGSGTVTNTAGGVIQGNGAVSAPLGSNAGFIHATGLLTLTSLTAHAASGELLVDPGVSLNISTAFSSAGFISMGGTNARLASGTITNTGLIEGTGRITSPITNNGVIRATAPGTLTLSGAVTNGVGSRMEIGNNAEVLASGGLATNAGLINLAGGRLETVIASLNNTGLINGHGTLATGGLTNNGTVTLTGGDSTVHGSVTNAATKFFRVTGGTVLFSGNFTNNGTFKNTGAAAVFAATYTENGVFISDPASNWFFDLVVSPAGYLIGGEGDVFIIGQDFLNGSAAGAEWDTAAAALEFSGGADHTAAVAGMDLGPDRTGYTDNFAWKSIRLRAGESLTLADGNATPGGAIYTSALVLEGGLAQIPLVRGDGHSIYYNPHEPANVYLHSATWPLTGGGFIEPVETGLAFLHSVILPAGEVQLYVLGVPGFLHRVEASSDLVNWSTIGTATAAPDGTFTFTDNNAGSILRRFYRVSFP